MLVHILNFDYLTECLKKISLLEIMTVDLLTYSSWEKSAVTCLKCIDFIGGYY